MPVMTAATTTRDTPRSPAAINAHVAAPRPSAPKTAPGISKCAAPPASARLSGTWRAAIHSTTAATGRLIQNTARHDPASTSQPPRSGPDGCGNAPESRPRSYRAAAVSGNKRHLNNCEAPWREQRAAHALQHARSDQDFECRRQRTHQRSNRKPRDADLENQPSVILPFPSPHRSEVGWRALFTTASGLLPAGTPFRHPADTNGVGLEIRYVVRR